MKGYIMKKILLFAVATLAFIGSASAQSLRFVNHETGELYDNNIEITTYDADADFMMLDWKLDIINTTYNDIDVMIEVNIVELNGMGFQFCGNAEVSTSICYAPTIGVTTYGPYMATAGSSANYFHGGMWIMNAEDGARVTYTIYDNENPDDKSVITVLYTKEAYDKGVASVDKTLASDDVKVFQRGGNLVCNYNFATVANRSIVVSNIVGARVATVALDGNNGEAVINRLPKGVYVYTLVENGRNVQSHKVIVR